MGELENRQRIIENIEENVFVEAGAGAGKTTLIVNRILNQLKQGWEPGSIVVITFTNAAAEELRSRIIQKVKEASKESDNLKSALLKLDMMNISTIHSFCFKLLQERIFDARLPMDVRLLEEEEADIHKESFFTEWAGRLTASEWQQLLKYGNKKYTIIQRLKSMFMSTCELPDNTNIYCNDTLLKKDLQQEASDLLDKCRQQFLLEAGKVCQSVLSGVANVPDDKLLKAGETAKKAFLVTDPNAYMESLMALKSIKEKDNIFKQSRKKEDAPLKPVVEKANHDYKLWLQQNVGPWLEECDDAFHTELLKFAVRARKAYRAGRPLYLMTNDDLLQKTERLLKESEEARKYFAEKYRCIYVDEFQDTDWIQERFIWRLAATKEDVNKLRDGALFLVGDPKQSIYRFRGAQPEVYFAVKKKMDDLDNAFVYCLDYNFRSNQKIIDWVNAGFEKKEICEEGYRPMVTQRTLPQGKISKLMAGVYCYKNPEGKATDYPTDAFALCQLILKLKNQGYLITDYNEDSTPYVREILYSDFLVLCNTKKNMDLYLNVMTDAGIPVVINGEISPGENRALKCYVRLFDYLTHPFDRAKKLGALEALHERGMVRAKKLLQYLQEETGGMSVYAIALYLRERMDVLLPEDTDIDASEVLSLQTKLEQMVEYVLSDNDVDSRVISERFWAYLNRKLKQEMSLKADAEAVRFMNLHKAKGLEGNIVILTKRDESLGFRESAFRQGNDFYTVASNEMNGYKTTVWVSYHKKQDIVDGAEKAEVQEQIRLEYVAATRPKQALIVMDGMNEKCMFTGYGLGELDEEFSVKDIIEKGQSVQISKQTARSYEVSAEQKADLSQREQVYCSSSPSSLEQSSAVRIKARKRYEEQKLPVSSKRPKGKDWGTIMHRSLQLLIDRWSEDFERIPEELGQIMQISVNQALVENLQEIGEEKIQQYQDFLKEVLGCFAQWVYEEKILRQAKQVYTEFPFSFYGGSIPGMNEVPTWMNGTADLIIQEKDGSFWVLDYKSDSDYYMTEEEFAVSLREIYSGQLAMYRHAIQRLFNVDEVKVRCGIISFAGTEDISVRYTEM